MKRSDDMMEFKALSGTGRRIYMGIVPILFLFFFGCATVPPQPMTIKHERTPSQSDSALRNDQSPKEPATKSVTAPVDQQSPKEPVNKSVMVPVDQQSPKEPAKKSITAPVVDQQTPKEPAEDIAVRERVPALPSDAVVTKQQQSRQEPVDQTIAALVALLKEKNLISADEAAHIIEKSEARAVIEKKSVQEQVKSEVREELPKEIKKVELAAAAPEWTKRIHFGGDIRLRYENDRFDQDNADFADPAHPNQLMNTKIDHDRFKYRVRFGAEAKVSEQLDAVIRLSTGNTTNPVSTNSIMGDYLNKDSVVFDLAYLKWQPWEFLTIYGGRMPNPWFTPSWLVWDDDLNFEGVALNVQQPVTETLTSFLTVGAFPLNDYDFSSHTKWLTGGQLGLERKSSTGVAAKIGAAYYYFSNITGIRNNSLHPGETDWTAPQYQQKGNTLFDISADPAVIKTALASEFKELNLSGSLDIGLWDPYHIVLAGDYVKNFGFDKADVAGKTGDPNPSEDTAGYNIGISVGYPDKENFGQWKASLQYKYIEADAVVDAFTDSDFHLGGTNAKGWILGGDFALRKNIWLALKWITANEISGPPLAIDVLFVDINARF